MKRAAVSSILVVAVQLAVGAVTGAQQPRKVPRIAFLMASSPGADSRVDGFRQGLREPLINSAARCQRRRGELNYRHGLSGNHTHIQDAIDEKTRQQLTATSLAAWHTFCANLISRLCCQNSRRICDNNTKRDFMDWVLSGGCHGVSVRFKLWPGVNLTTSRRRSPRLTGDIKEQGRSHLLTCNY